MFDHQHCRSGRLVDTRMTCLYNVHTLLLLLHYHRTIVDFTLRCSFGWSVRQTHLVFLHVVCLSTLGLMNGRKSNLRDVDL